MYDVAVLQRFCGASLSVTVIKSPTLTVTLTGFDGATVAGTQAVSLTAAGGHQQVRDACGMRTAQVRTCMLSWPTSNEADCRICRHMPVVLCGSLPVRTEMRLVAICARHDVADANLRPALPQVFLSGFTGTTKSTLKTSGQATGSASVFAVDNMCLA